jgi:two-component system phosphate regulon sensor histidine kinase PhoR
MHRSRLFWKLLLASSGLSLAAVVALGLVLSGRLQDEIVRQVDRRLRDSAQLLSGELREYLASEPNDALQKSLRQLGQETQTRFTLIAADGTVLADSECETLDEVRAMNNHRDRPEVLQSRTRGEGWSMRSSATFSQPHRYVVVRVDDHGKPLGYVRSALPMADIHAQTAAVRRRTWGLVAAVCLCLFAAAYWIVGQILRPVKPLTDAAEAIAAGNFEQRLYLANRDELGTLARAFARISQDLHARSSQVDQTLHRQSTVLGGMIEGVIAVDARQRIVLANSAAGRLFQFPASAAEGRPLLEVVRNHSVHDAVAAALASGQPQRVETKSSPQSPAPSRQHIEIHVQPLTGQPCPGVVLVMHDTTELRRLESLRRDFIANVSHELKTPLSSIKAYAETLRNGAVHDAETTQKFLGRIEEQSDRLNRLINDMLMLARIESDLQPFEIVAVEMPAVVAACLDDYRAAAEAKRIELSVEPDLPPFRVRADREGLREILNNLVDNAIKYTPEGGCVTVAWSEQGAGDWGLGAGVKARESTTQSPAPSPPPPTIRISVRDTGIGIKSKDQERVFERFYRVDKARSREVGGTGLGLAIVKHLAQCFGGRVSVESEVGQGSTFSVELPQG